MFLRDELALLIAQRCNAEGESLPLIRQRLYDTFKAKTYLIRFDAQEQIIGWLDYDITYDQLVHVRKVIALSPGILRSMVSELKRTLPWKRVFFKRVKYIKNAKGGWRHHGKPWRLRHAMA